MKHGFLIAVLLSALCLSACGLFREDSSKSTESPDPFVVDSFCLKTELHDGSGEPFDSVDTDITNDEDPTIIYDSQKRFFYIRMLTWSDGSISVAKIPKPITIWDKPDTTDPKETIVLKDRVLVSCLESNG